MKKNEWKYYSRIAYSLDEASPIKQPFIICTDLDWYGKGLTPIPHPLENYLLNSRISKFLKIGLGHTPPPPQLGLGPRHPRFWIRAVTCIISNSEGWHKIKMKSWKWFKVMSYQNYVKSQSRTEHYNII